MWVGSNSHLPPTTEYSVHCDTSPIDPCGSKERNSTLYPAYPGLQINSSYGNEIASARSIVGQDYMICTERFARSRTILSWHPLWSTRRPPASTDGHSRVRPHLFGVFMFCLEGLGMRSTKKNIRKRKQVEQLQLTIKSVTGSIDDNDTSDTTRLHYLIE